MRNIGQLRRVEKQLIKDLKESALSLVNLGKRYGVSRQAIFQFAQKMGIKRPKREHTKNCSFCLSLLRIAQKPHSDFISSQTIKEQLRLGSQGLAYHIHILSENGLISPKFGKLRSRKAELVYQLYFKKGLPVETIRKQVKFKNLNEVIKRHKTLGWNVPDSFFTYNGKQRRKLPLKKRTKSSLLNPLNKDLSSLL
jgi:biotin operon repressor